jgi:hypothetical protein
MATREKAEKAGPETRTVTYLAPGVAPDLTPGTPSLDPELEKIREREAEKLAEVKIDRTPMEPTIDPELIKARDAQIKRETDRAAGREVGDSASAESAPIKKPAKKSTSTTKK